MDRLQNLHREYGTMLKRYHNTHVVWKLEQLYKVKKKIGLSTDLTSESNGASIETIIVVPFRD